MHTAVKGTNPGITQKIPNATEQVRQLPSQALCNPLDVHNGDVPYSTFDAAVVSGAVRTVPLPLPG